MLNEQGIFFLAAMIVVIITLIWISMRIYQILKRRSQIGAKVVALTVCAAGVVGACRAISNLSDGRSDRDLAELLILGGVLFLAAMSALRVARRMLLETAKLGRIWSLACSALTFGLCFFVFAFVMGLVTGVFFGR
jgi:hypothetical protein